MHVKPGYGPGFEVIKSATLVDPCREGVRSNSYISSNPSQNLEVVMYEDEHGVGLYIDEENPTQHSTRSAYSVGTYMFYGPRSRFRIDFRTTDNHYDQS